MLTRAWPIDIENLDLKSFSHSIKTKKLNAVSAG